MGKIERVLPAPPIPATALPKIKNLTLGATAQKRESSSNQHTEPILQRWVIQCEKGTMQDMDKVCVLDVFSIEDDE
jgi:hypothetical protein